MLDPRLRLLAEKIRRLVQASDFTQTEIADRLGVDKSAVSRWIKGERTPTMKNLIDLADLLQVEMTELWVGAEAVPATPEQKAMLGRMADLSPEQQQALLALAATMAKQ